jgi:hypothetical protein
VLLAPVLGRVLGPSLRPALVAAAAGGLTSAVLCLPALHSAFSASSGLSAYASGWSVNNMPYAWLSWFVYVLTGSDVGERILRLSFACIMGCTALGLAWRPVADLDDAARRMLATAALLFYFSPAQFPWYAAWFLPLAAFTGNRPLLLASATLPVYYAFFPLAAAGRAEVHGYGLAALHLLPVLIALAVSLLRRPAVATT